MIVKICGVTREQDALAAVACGASAIGFVFWPGSPRFIDPFRARRIASALPPFVTTVGVFVNQPDEYVNGVASLVPLGAVQLHGDETPEFARRICRPVMKALAETGPKEVDAWPERVLLMIDARDPVRRGGTGKKADWVAAAEVARRRPIVLAGGLTAENVAEAIATVQPAGLDVSSGVESSPGVKDPRRIAELFEAIARGQTMVAR